jgi:polysaccharide export outer membrane protein
MRLNRLILIVIILLLSNSALAAESSNVYHIGPDDRLEISVWRDESLSREVVVPPDNIISFPLVGEIDVTNMTVTDLRRKVIQKLKDYIPDATVTIILKEIKSLKAYVIGKVNRPGQYPIAMDTSVMQLLSKAGGLNPYAAESKIHILRQVGGETKKIPFNYGEVLKGKNLKQNIIVERGDVIVVP